MSYNIVELYIIAKDNKKTKKYYETRRYAIDYYVTILPCNPEEVHYFVSNGCNLRLTFSSGCV